MKTLRFKGPIRFEVLGVVDCPEVCHLVGHFLTGKFRNERRLRVEIDDRWYGLKNHVIELPGHELREVTSNWQPGRRAIIVPACAGNIYVMPLEASTFKFDDVKVVEFTPPKQLQFDEIGTWRGYLRNPR